MLTIRREQLAVLSQTEAQKFEEWMLVHLTKFFPQQCRIAEEAQLRATIQYGTKRAAAYGITAKPDVCKYIDLMVVFGRDFDRDSEYPWAAEILDEPVAPGTRIQKLHEAAKNHLRQS